MAREISSIDNMPLISIITPTYNRKELLEKAIISVIHQKQDVPFDWEMLIIDDGSTDNSGEYIQSYLVKYPNIKYIFIENVGMNNARNIGFDLMSPESSYLILLDSDDELIEDCISSCLGKIQELENHGLSEDYLGLVYFAEDEYGNLIGNKKILNGFSEVVITYTHYLSGFPSFEPGFFFKSEFFLKKENRFDIDVPSGGSGILLAKWWKKEMGEGNKKFLFFDYIGRMYRQNNSGRLTFEFTKNKKRFLENAISTDRILKIIGDDMLQNNLEKTYGENLFRTGINYLLGGETSLGVSKIEQSLKYKKTVIHFLLFLIAYIYPNIVYTLYKIYVQFEYSFLKR